MSQPNVRVRRTRALLREALVELIEDRGFDHVTVGDLTSRAMISRAAFYRNYRDKYELVEQIFDEAMAGMTARDGGDTRSPARRWADFLVHIDDYHRLYGALLGRKGSAWFTDRMRSALAAMASEHMPGRDADALVPSVISAISSSRLSGGLSTIGRVRPRRSRSSPRDLSGRSSKARPIPACHP